MSKVTQEMAEAESIHRNMIAAHYDVPKLLVQKTEAEWREEYEKWAKQQNMDVWRNEYDGPQYANRETKISWATWLAALRLVGAIKEDGK